MRQSKITGYSNFRIFGNLVFNMIFSICLGYKVSDPGSGLNMYKVDALRSRFYLKYPDSLIFNCVWLNAVKCYKQSHIFCPITWREEDQISNVKLFSQAKNTLKQLFQYTFSGKRFLEKEHRDIIIDKYLSDQVKCKVEGK